VHYPRTLKLLPIVDISILFELLGLAKRFAAQFGDTGSDTNAQQDPASRADAKRRMTCFSVLHGLRPLPSAASTLLSTRHLSMP